MKRGRLSDEERTEIERLAELGWKAKAIARTLDRLPQTVSNRMTTAGLRCPVDRSFSYLRNGKPVRSFSREEDAEIERLSVQRLSASRIATACEQKFGYRRMPATINTRLRMIATREEGVVGA